MAMDWDNDMRRLWEHATTEVGWGIWRVRDTGDAPVEITLTRHGQPVLLTVPSLWAVTTLEGRPVALTGSRAVADLLATVPDLMDPALRPDGSGTHPGTASGDRAFERGWGEGHAVGQAEAFDEATEIVSSLLDALGQIPDPEVQGAVAKARIEWDAVTDDWPAHEGHGDEADLADAPDPARPVC